MTDQTWKNLEILVVDDHSSDDTAAIVERLASADCRIRLLRLESNRGPYVARNRALAAASGDFITVNDADDWSHPQKLQIQIEHVLKSNAAASASHFVRVGFDLHFSGGARHRERLPHLNFSSLMLPAGIVREFGGWDPVRFGADDEFLNRVEARHGTRRLARLHAGLPLSFALLREDSLINLPASHLLTHFSGVRKEYTEAWRRWHKRAWQAQDFRTNPDPAAPRSFPAPAAMLAPESGMREFDVVFVSDLSARNSRIEAAVGEIRAAIASGLRTGIFHWPCYSKQRLHDPCDAITRLIDEGAIESIVPAQEAAAEALVFCEAEAFRYRYKRAPAIRCKRAIMVIGNEAVPVSWRQSAMNNIEAMFGAVPEVQTGALLAGPTPAIQSED